MVAIPNVLVEMQFLLPEIAPRSQEKRQA